jgi:hypothetical protein
VKEFFLVNQQYRNEKEKLLNLLIPTYDEKVLRYIKLHTIVSILEKFDIQYFAINNLMLGCMRHKGFIPWDDKYELMILENECGKITIDLKYELLYAGFQLKKIPEGYVISDFLDGDFYVTLYVGRYIDDDIINYVDEQLCLNNTDKFIYKRELLPLKKYDFGAFSIKGLQNANDYLNRIEKMDYQNSDTIISVYHQKKNDILHEFLRKYHLQSLLIRDVSLLTQCDDIPMTDDWKYYFIRAKDLIPFDFNYYTYLLLNKDLKPSDYTEPTDLFIHYIKHGKQENRIYCFDLPLDFDIMGYKCLNPELLDQCKTDKELCAHYMTIGSKMKKQYNIRSILPDEFDVDTYAYLNDDLDCFNNDECKLINHYVTIGRHECRYYTYNRILPKDFDHQKYLNLNPDLQRNNIKTKRDAIIHYVKYGRQQNRKYK